MTVVRSGAASDVGRVRTVNQDMVLESANLFAVADGMGGHVGGEVAAKMAVDTLKAVFGRQASTAGLEQAVSDANAAVWSQGHAISDLRGMGTTLTAAALVVGSDGRDKVALANVGDSRAYLFTAGQLTQITVDHSLAEEKVRYGEMTEAEAAVHPHRHILTRALGVSDEVEVDVWELHLRTGDRLLLCSDGLTNEVPEAEIARVLSSEPDPEVVARVLVNTANRHGGNDNTSVLVVDVLVGDDSVATPDIVTPRATRPATRPVVPVVAVDGSVTGVVPQATTGIADLAGPAAVIAPPGGGGTDAGLGTGSLGVGVDEARPGALSSAAPLAARVADPVRRDAAIAPVSAPVVGPADAPARKESRRERRRRLGVPRRLTFRVLGFLVLLVAVVVGAYVVVRWYATDNWYVTVHDNQLVVYQGRPGGLLWFEPKIVDRTGVSTSEVLSIHLGDLRATVQEPSLTAAKHYVIDLQREYAAQQQASSSPPPSTAPVTGATAPAVTTSTGAP